MSDSRKNSKNEDLQKQLHARLSALTISDDLLTKKYTVTVQNKSKEISAQEFINRRYSYLLPEKSHTLPLLTGNALLDIELLVKQGYPEVKKFKFKSISHKKGEFEATADFESKGQWYGLTIDVHNFTEKSKNVICEMPTIYQKSGDKKNEIKITEDKSTKKEEKISSNSEEKISVSTKKPRSFYEVIAAIQQMNLENLETLSGFLIANKEIIESIKDQNPSGKDDFIKSIYHAGSIPNLTLIFDEVGQMNDKVFLEMKKISNDNVGSEEFLPIIVGIYSKYLPNSKSELDEIFEKVDLILSISPMFVLPEMVSRLTDFYSAVHDKIVEVTKKNNAKFESDFQKNNELKKEVDESEEKGEKRKREDKMILDIANTFPDLSNNLTGNKKEKSSVNLERRIVKEDMEARLGKVIDIAYGEVNLRRLLDALMRKFQSSMDEKDKCDSYKKIIKTVYGQIDKKGLREESFSLIIREANSLISLHQRLGIVTSLYAFQYLGENGSNLNFKNQNFAFLIIDLCSNNLKEDNITPEKLNSFLMDLEIILSSMDKKLGKDRFPVVLKSLIDVTRTHCAEHYWNIEHSKDLDESVEKKANVSGKGMFGKKEVKEVNATTDSSKLSSSTSSSSSSNVTFTKKK